MLKFELTIDEANIVLGALAKAPFEQVAGLIGKIRDQAQPQLANAQQPPQGEDTTNQPNVD